jgi:hypothetical protein
VLSLLSVILGPVLGILDKIFGYVSNVETTKLQTTAAVDEESIKGMATVERQWWFVALMIPAIMVAFIPWLYKSAIWDKIIAPHLSWCHGACATTDPVSGTLGTVFITAVGGIFLHGITNRS